MGMERCDAVLRRPVRLRVAQAGRDVDLADRRVDGEGFVQNRADRGGLRQFSDRSVND